MASVRVTICNKKGLHARAAAKLVKAAANFPETQIRVANGANSAGAGSILGLLMLAGERGVEIELSAEGPQAAQAIDELSALIARRFDEEE